MPKPKSAPQKSVLARAKKIRLVLTDCDGVLTDGGVFYSGRGEEMKRFNIRDGMGVRLLKELLNIETGIITGERSESVKRRADKLNISELFLGVEEKAICLSGISERLKIKFENIAYIGDDINDLEVLGLVGLSACPKDAILSVRRAVHYCCRNRGGNGAFRELSDLIIKAQASKVPTPQKLNPVGD